MTAPIETMLGAIIAHIGTTFPGGKFKAHQGPHWVSMGLSGDGTDHALFFMPNGVNELVVCVDRELVKPYLNKTNNAPPGNMRLSVPGHGLMDVRLTGIPGVQLVQRLSLANHVGNDMSALFRFVLSLHELDMLGLEPVAFDGELNSELN